MSHAAAVANDDEALRMIQGANGHAALTAAGLSDTLLALFDKLVRGLPEDSVRVLVEEVMKDARKRAEPEMVKNLFVMAFHTRWCRGGKGERTLFYTLLKVLYARYPTVVLDLADLIPKYGYWKGPPLPAHRVPAEKFCGAGLGLQRDARQGVVALRTPDPD